MTGLRRICKLYGGMVINGKRYVWDYVADQPVPESEMGPDSQRWKESERRRYELVRDAIQSSAAKGDA